MFVAVWKDGKKVCRSVGYEDDKMAVKYAIKKIKQGFDAVVISEEEFEEIMEDRKARGLDCNYRVG